MTFEGLPIDSMDTAAFYESVVGRNWRMSSALSLCQWVSSGR